MIVVFNTGFTGCIVPTENAQKNQHAGLKRITNVIPLGRETRFELTRPKIEHTNRNMQSL